MCDKLINNKCIKVIATLLIFPLISVVTNVLTITIFNSGNYLGTFIRHLYNIVVC